MKRSRGRLVDLNSPADLELRIAAGAAAISGWHFLSLDLAPYGGWLRRVEVGGALFLGCRFGPGDEESVRARGAMVFPQLPGTPVDSYRTGLYTADELYGHGAYADSLDARAYGWAHRPPAREATLARALHDHSIDAA
ncbi:MAG: Rossmann fold nucleotide-binding protein, partial [Nocardioides sp.]